MQHFIKQTYTIKQKSLLIKIRAGSEHVGNQRSFIREIVNSYEMTFENYLLLVGKDI